MITAMSNALSSSASTRAGDHFRSRSRRGMTLIEMCIVLLILSILVSIAVPAVMNARSNAQAKSCVASLWQIEGAKQRWAMENRKGPDDLPTREDLSGHVKVWPECPSGGAYEINVVDTAATCSIGGNHVIP